MKKQFEWDTNKAGTNLRKHGVSFDTATKVFTDPLMLTAPDRVQDNEERWIALGIVDDQLLLLVVHTVKEFDDLDTLVEVIRIISARPADPKERRMYEEGTYK